MFVNVGEAINVLRIKCQREPPFKKTIYEDTIRMRTRRPHEFISECRYTTKLPEN